jgi:hypothetical protein
MSDLDLNKALICIRCWKQGRFWQNVLVANVTQIYSAQQYKKLWNTKHV